MAATFLDLSTLWSTDSDDYTSAGAGSPLSLDADAAGGITTSTITVTATTDYRSQSLSGINTIQFATSGSATATFVSSQFAAGSISSYATIVGSGNPDTIEVFSDDGGFSASFLTFQNWTSGVDRLVIHAGQRYGYSTGSSYDDVIYAGTSYGNIDGGGGSNTLKLTEMPGGQREFDGGAQYLTAGAARYFVRNFSTIDDSGSTQYDHFTNLNAGMTIRTGDVGSLVDGSGTSAGNETIVGGAGLDIYSLTGYSRAQLTVQRVGADTVTVTSPHGTDTLTGVEWLQSSEGRTWLGSSPRRVAGDFDGDSQSDLLWRHSGGALAEWTMNDRTITDSGLIGGDANWTVVGTGDFNGDGKADILQRNSTTGLVLEWTMNGRMVTGTGVVGGDLDWSVIGTGDFNGDGRSDLLWRQASTGALAEWDMGAGGMTSQSSGLLGLDPNWMVVGTGDFNGDGKTDILQRNSATGLVLEWTMNDRTVTGSAVLGGDLDWGVVGTGDFNGDGRSDILWRQASTGALAQWDMGSGGLSPQSTGLIGVDPNWIVVGTGDFNNDGFTDILRRNSGTGQVMEWDMNDRTVVSSGLIGGDTDWSIVSNRSVNLT